MVEKNAIPLAKPLFSLFGTEEARTSQCTLLSVFVCSSPARPTHIIFSEPAFRFGGIHLVKNDLDMIGTSRPLGAKVMANVRWMGTAPSEVGEQRVCRSLFGHLGPKLGKA